MKTVLLETERGAFNVRIYGDEQKPPLIMLHGWPQTSYCWHHCAPFLKDFYVICPDLRGMGDSNRELDLKFYVKDEMAEDIFAVADTLGVGQFYLAGHDWGGAIVQEMTFLKPERIRKLIIINMIIINNPEGVKNAEALLVKHHFRSSWYQHMMSIKELPEALIEGKEDVWVRFFSRGITNPIPEDAIEEYTRCYKIPNSISTASNIYRTLKEDRKRWKAYAKHIVSVPTKIIHGYLDPVIIKEYLHNVESCYADLEVEKIKGGHFLVDEQPRQVGEAITQFLLK